MTRAGRTCAPRPRRPATGPRSPRRQPVSTRCGCSASAGRRSGCASTTSGTTESAGDVGTPLTPADLDAFAAECGAFIPPAYRAFILNQNGGYPYPCQLPGSGGHSPWYLESFNMVPPPGWHDQDHSEDRVPPEVQPNYDDDHASDLGRVLWIGQDGNSGGLLLGLEGEAAGRVYWHPDIVHEDVVEGEYTLLAESLPELFPLFMTTDPVWLQHIRSDDLAALSAWLAAGGDPNAVDRENDWRPLGNAVTHGRAEVVKLLLDAGAIVNDTAWECANRSDNAAVKKLVLAACPTRPAKPKRKRKS